MGNEQVGFACFLLGIFCAYLWSIRKKLQIGTKRAELAKQAANHRYDLCSEIIKMLQDPAVTETEWWEMLKMARFADQFYAKSHPRVIRLHRLEDLVLRRLKSKA